MEWELYDIDGSYLQDVNCEYDSADLSRWEHGATELRLDFVNKKAYILSKEGVID